MVHPYRVDEEEKQRAQARFFSENHNNAKAMTPKIFFGGNGNKSDKEEERKSFRRLAQYFGLGTQLAAAVAGFGLIGYWLDSKFGTGEKYTTILLFLGAIGGLYSFIKTVIDMGKNDKEDDSDDSNDKT